MGYSNLQSCVRDLQRIGELCQFDEEIDPFLEVAAVQRRLFAAGGPAVLFTRPKSVLSNRPDGLCEFPMLANFFGTEKRVHYIFRDGIEPLKRSLELGADPIALLTNRFSLQSIVSLGLHALSSFYYSKPKLVRQRNAPVLECTTSLSSLPQLVSWPDDGGAYLTLPQVYTEHPIRAGFSASNIGMYRVQISGNDYLQNHEAGLHYQIHRGIAMHHAAAIENDLPLRVNIFLGGAPAMTLAAIMPLPENVSELIVAGILAQKRIPMTKITHDSLPIYAQADFCISGTMQRNTKLEGPFGDHLGYYSLAHDFPVLKIDKVWHRKDAIFPFTVVGRPPQEDTMFGSLIHYLTGDAISKRILGVHAVHAVDAAGVHPLLLALGREEYLPMEPNRRALELHTLAHAILGCGQLSLAKYLFIAAKEDDSTLDVHDIPRFFRHILERVDWKNDAHFVTKTSADTLDYTCAQLHRGSKMVIAVAGKPIRKLADSLDNNSCGDNLHCKNSHRDNAFPAKKCRVVLPGILCIESFLYNNFDTEMLSDSVKSGFPLIVLVDDVDAATKSFSDFIWTTFTKSDPATDVHGFGEFTSQKHWGCTGPLLIDARRKPHHAPELVEPYEVAKKADLIVDKILNR
ncbi:MAG: UbiD family decarboxylase [Thermoguttaceae bacterium]